MITIELNKNLGSLSIEARLELGGREILALFGPSGSGKTSIINMIAGLLKPDRGRIKVRDRLLFCSGNKIDLAPEKRRIGYIFQDGRLFPHLSVRNNLNYGLNLVPASDRRLDFDEVVAVLGVEKLLHRRPHNLSGGEKQRAAIGRALLTSPTLLLMDEPLTSVDEERKQDILALTRTIPEKFEIPIIYVSHYPEEIETLSARVVRIKNGKTAGSPDLAG
ncbi:MAG: molybdenum ABC transporter ATP-binding protein [Pseudomonadota bacterium]